VARLGADGVKLLVHYYSEAPGAAAHEELVARVAEDCQAHELPFFLEPLSYTLDPQHMKLPPAERRELVVETAERLTSLGVDVLKAEFPVDPASGVLEVSSSRCRLILMDQSTEQIAPAQPAKDRSAARFCKHRRHGRHVAKAAVRTVPVVVLHIDLQHTNKLPAADDQ
jgi:tagatose-1,6-bisphosphate aldolase